MVDVLLMEAFRLDGTCTLTRLGSEGVCFLHFNRNIHEIRYSNDLTTNCRFKELLIAYIGSTTGGTLGRPSSKKKKKRRGNAVGIEIGFLKTV